nr:hypothetical protein BaRGS_000897 [Batillaria attramentaria]
MSSENFSEYVTCAQTRLSDCSAEVRAFADEYVVNATLLYNGNTYYCDEHNPCLEEFRFCNTSVVPNSLIPGVPCSRIAVVVVLGFGDDTMMLAKTTTATTMMMMIMISDDNGDDDDDDDDG